MDRRQNLICNNNHRSGNLYFENRPSVLGMEKTYCATKMMTESVFSNISLLKINTDVHYIFGISITANTLNEEYFKF
jgi:hypothetical protein